MAAADAQDDIQLNRLVAAQLQKTKMCAMHIRGTCRDPKCRFAHSTDELRSAPDLTKTAICRLFSRGQCQSTNCTFAHGEQELRVTSTVYKTQLCNFHMRGHCKKGNRCRHAHGEDELRTFLSSALQTKAPASSPPRTPTPANSEDTQSTGITFASEETDATTYINPGLVDEMDVPYNTSPQDILNFVAASANRMPQPTPSPDWYASLLAAEGISPTGLSATPPGRVPYLNINQPTPEKVIPPFPGVQRPPTPDEPMKVPLSPAGATPGLAGAAMLNPLSRVTPEDLVAAENLLASQRAMQLAWAEHALAAKDRHNTMVDFELAAAQLKVQWLQAKRNLYNSATAARLVGSATSSHFDNIMQTLRTMTPQPGTPPELVRAPSPPGLQPGSVNFPGRSSTAMAPSPAAEIQKPSTAWVI